MIETPPSSPPARSACIRSVERASLVAPWSCCRREHGFGEDRAAAAALVLRVFRRRIQSARTRELGQEQAGMRRQADRRVEVLMFDDGEEPDLRATNGEDVYDDGLRVG